MVRLGEEGNDADKSTVGLGEYVFNTLIRPVGLLITWLLTLVQTRQPDVSFFRRRRSPSASSSSVILLLALLDLAVVPLLPPSAALLRVVLITALLG